MSDSIKSYRDYLEFKKADLEAYQLQRWLPHNRLTHPTLYYQRVMRDVELFRALGWKRVAHIRQSYLKLVGIVTGISIPPGVFGRGLTVPHYGSVVVNNHVTAGMYCRIHSSTNIGEYGGHAPTLGDGVYIGPGAVIFGKVHVGDNSAVGANSVVNRDVPMGVVVAGAPAEIVSNIGNQRVMPAWILSAIEHLAATEHEREVLNSQ